MFKFASSLTLLSLIGFFAPAQEVFEIKEGNHGNAVFYGTPESGYDLKWFSLDQNRGFLGVTLINLTPELRHHYNLNEDSGLLIGRIEADSGAEIAGLQVGDILIEIDGEPASSATQAAHILGKGKPGESVLLKIKRNEDILEISADLGKAPENIALRKLKQSKMPKLVLEGDIIKQIQELPDFKNLEVVQIPNVNLLEKIEKLEKRLAELEALLSKQND